jgi:hypothetical protein
MTTNYNYTWQVKDVDEPSKSMLVEYTLDGFRTHLVGMPLPTATVDIEQRIEQYAPIPMWQHEILDPVAVPIGMTGGKAFTMIEPYAPNSAQPGSNSDPGSPSANPA